jgi:hypothetical protein
MSVSRRSIRAPPSDERTETAGPKEHLVRCLLSNEIADHPSAGSSNFRDPLTDILLHGGSGMRKTCDQVHLYPP